MFAEEESRIEQSFPPIIWTKPSESDPDVLSTQPPNSVEDGALAPPAEIQGSRLRGVILHKLMEELATGELAADASEIRDRSHQLCL